MSFNIRNELDHELFVSKYYLRVLMNLKVVCFGSVNSLEDFDINFDREFKLQRLCFNFKE